MPSLLQRLFRAPQTIYWYGRAAEYRYATGAAVPQAEVLAVTQEFIDEYVAANIDDLATRLIDGRLSLPAWQQQMARELKDAHIVSLHVGRGGQAVTTFADYGRVGRLLRDEYQLLQQFATEIYNGNLSPAQIRVRAALYGANVRQSYWTGQTAAHVEAEYGEERRLLAPADHCAQCPDYAALGWQPIGTLPEPGEACDCGANCKCEKEYRYYGIE